jgi:hypothetical protein
MKFRLPFLLLVFILSACSALDDPVVKTFRRSTGLAGEPENSRFYPGYRYLRIAIDGRITYLALGSIDHGTEIWYSSEREVVRLRQGRIAGAEGVYTEWRKVVLPKFPAWSKLAKSKKPYAWTRIRDVMPGYRYGIRDRLRLESIPVREKSNLKNLDPARLAWFEEKDLSGHLPPAYYAVELESNRVIYAETCLSKSFCFSWQRWK